MDELIISLTGEITNTNFEEWKKDLITQIESIKTDLQTDEDFGIATDQTKNLKAAETALKKAKESAIEQAADIQKLFGAIDEVSNAAREARLNLERQIKTKKAEIKDSIIDGGVRKIRTLLESQGEDFHLLNNSEYTDRETFVGATKGKRGTDGMDAAINLLVEQMTGEIATKAEAVEARGKKLARIDPGHQALFQDREFLFRMNDEELDAEMTKRVEVFEKNAAASPKEEVAEASDQSGEGDDLDNLFGEGGVQVPGEAEGTFRVVISVSGEKAEAESLTEEVRAAYAGRENVDGVILESGTA